MLGTVYLLHLKPGLPITGGRVAWHYLGWTASDVDAAGVELHVGGRGSPLVRAAIVAGCTVTVQRTWPDVDRHFERRLKTVTRRHGCASAVSTRGATGGRGLLAPAQAAGALA